MPSKLTFQIAHPLPPWVSPDDVLAALHSYEPLITPNPYLVSFARRPVQIDEIVSDPFFRDDGRQLVAYEVRDRVPLVPGLAHKSVTIPCVMQSFDGGVRCRSLAQAGVKVWSTWTLRLQEQRPSRDRRDRDAAGTGSDSDSVGPAKTTVVGMAAGWELVEEAKVECSPLVKPFVTKSFEAGHREILRKVIEGVAQRSAESQAELLRQRRLSQSFQEDRAFHSNPIVSS